MFTKAFWIALAERAVKTFAQAFVATVIASGVLDVFEVNWQEALGVAALATLLSVLTTIASGGLTGGNASLAKSSEVTTPPGTIAVDPGEHRAI